MFDSLNIFKKQKNSQLSESLDKLSKDYLSSSAIKKIREAIDFANKAHEGQFRKSGEPFITHPINVGLILVSLKMDEDTFACDDRQSKDQNSVKNVTTEDIRKEIEFGVEIQRKIRTRREFWPQAAFWVNVQSLLHAINRYLQDIPPASASSWGY